MNKLKLQAKLIDLGVLEEEDTIRIKETTPPRSVYITIIKGLNDVETYEYQENRLVFVGGTGTHIADITRMSTLDLEEFE